MIKNAPWIKYLPWLTIIAVCIYLWSTMIETTEKNIEDTERTITHSWKEEVLLQNNHVILVQRHQKIHIKPVKDSYDEVIIHDMSVEVISDNAKNPPPKWDYPLAPLVFDYDQEKDEWFIIATYFSSVNKEINERTKDQDSPFIKYIFNNGNWVIDYSKDISLFNYPSNIFAYGYKDEKFITHLERRKIINRVHDKTKVPSNLFCATLKQKPPFKCSRDMRPPKQKFALPVYYKKVIKK